MFFHGFGRLNGLERGFLSKLRHGTIVAGEKSWNVQRLFTHWRMECGRMGAWIGVVFPSPVFSSLSFCSYMNTSGEMLIRKKRRQRSCSLRWRLFVYYGKNILSFTFLRTAFFTICPPGAIVFSCCVLTDFDTASSRWCLRRLMVFVLRFYQLRYSTYDLRWLHLSSREER